MEVPLLGLKKLEEKENFGRFAIEPLPPGFGHTLGASLRRVLLSQIPGAAVTQVKFEGVPHQFTTIPGVREDLVELSLNLKKLRLRIHGNNPVVLELHAIGPGKVTAGDLEIPSEVKIVNKDLVLAHLADKKAKLSLELMAEPGKGYILASEREINKIGVIPLDSLYSPVLVVAYHLEATRVGRQTNFDRLILEITTDGTVSPSEALHTAAAILEEYYQVLSSGKKLEIREAKAGEGEEKARDKKLSEKERALPVDDLDLPVRVINSLKRSKIATLGKLLEKSDDDLVKIKNLGAKSIAQIKAAIKKEIPK